MLAEIPWCFLRRETAANIIQNYLSDKKSINIKNLSHTWIHYWILSQYCRYRSLSYILWHVEQHLSQNYTILLTHYDSISKTAQTLPIHLWHLWPLAKIFWINRFWSQPIDKQANQDTISKSMIQVTYCSRRQCCTLVTTKNLTANKPFCTEMTVFGASCCSHLPNVCLRFSPTSKK